METADVEILSLLTPRRCQHAQDLYLADLVGDCLAEGHACTWQVRKKKPALIPLKISASYENGIMTRVRMDKWLWAARFFKTRALCARACELGRIASNGQAAKASREVRLGDLLEVKTEGGLFQVEVLLLSEMRGPAVVARTLYRETEASRELRLKLAEEQKASPHFEALREGKPSKRDRRQLGRLRGRV